ncbi:AAA family ATPase [Oricola sp.]|uniref:AAA family ATPase n=1 Tax=Oricola sp. TaxID=1979950 RepID=UPI0025D7106F|nr:AAA family ATPase [Oricola sp.]MCI5073958.1 AAA family ATPase [Oricola sp.]
MSEQVVFHPDHGAGTIVRASSAGNGYLVNFEGGASLSILSSFLYPTAEAAAEAKKRRTPAPEIERAPHVRDMHLSIVPASEFAARETPQRQFLDERRLIPLRNVTIISGDGGTGKSLLALQLGMGVAAGGIWLGRRVREGSVLYFSAEDDEDETHIRFKEICAAEGLHPSSFNALGFDFRAGKEAALAVEVPRSAVLQRTPLMGALEAAMGENSPVLLILDNLADVFAGNEVSRVQARQFIGMMRGLALKHDCAVVLLSHPSVAGMNSGTGSSGSTAWNNSVRSRLYLRRDVSDDGSEADADARILETKKTNYARAGDETRLRWEDGRFVAVEETRQDNGDPIAQATKAERVFLHLLDWHSRKGLHVSPNKSNRYAPTVFARHGQCEGVKARQFERAMETLFEHGQIEIDRHGPPSKPRNHIVRAGDADHE